jgi:hypothetical protein
VVNVRVRVRLGLVWGLMLGLSGVRVTDRFGLNWVTVRLELGLGLGLG